MTARRKTALATAAAAACLAAVMLTASAFASGSSSYSDPVGDAVGNGPDISKLDVANDDNSRLTVTVSIANRTSALDLDDIVAVIVGPNEVEAYFAYYFADGTPLRTCRLVGAVLDCASTAPITATVNGPNVTFTIDGGPLGIVGQMGVAAVTFRFGADGRPEDTDETDVFSYDLQVSGDLPGPMIDRSAPSVKALAGTGVHGKKIAIHYRVWDDTGSTREQVTVFQGNRLLWQKQVGYHRTSRSTMQTVSWKVPATLHGTLRVQVRAWDPDDNVSAPSWSTLKIR